MCILHTIMGFYVAVKYYFSGHHGRIQRNLRKCCGFSPLCGDTVLSNTKNLPIPMSEKTSVLFLCTGNSCRSQMAEGWAKALGEDRIEAYSAGIEKHGLNPNAVKVMTEAGVDISGHVSKTLEELEGVHFDHVVTVCGHANECCPVFPGETKIVHYSFDDPPKLAAEAKDEEEALSHYRRVRDEIRAFIKGYAGEMQMA